MQMVAPKVIWLRKTRPQMTAAVLVQMIAPKLVWLRMTWPRMTAAVLGALQKKLPVVMGALRK